jgi:phosphoenolpyruvate carboxylase
MTQTQPVTSEKFENAVGINFQLYNSLFLSLPFRGIEKTGTLLSLFNQTCDEGFENGKSPVRIIEDFFATNTSLTAENDKLDLLFRFVQYAERQVVLFDALEDATFEELHNMNGPGTLSQLETAVRQNGKQKELARKIENFGVRLVLTAHPTQFYPGAVLGIINDLAAAIDERDVKEIKILLQQLGLTPFFKKAKPTPYDEAVSLIWYLENVFYHAIGDIVGRLKDAFPDEKIDASNLVKMGFWSGGDRDGNPFVTVETTRNVAEALKLAILRSYHRDVRHLRRRLTFAGVEELLTELDGKLYQNAFQPDENSALTKEEILASLHAIRRLIDEKHSGLFIDLVDDLISKTELFGLHFASLDIRQDSSVHTEIYELLTEMPGVLPENFGEFSEDEKIAAILKIETEVAPEDFENELAADTFRNIRAVREIQKQNGESASNRYIISHTRKALDVVEVFGLFRLGGWPEDVLTVDIVPLFETVEDLRNAADTMRRLYRNETYREHLMRRNDTQTVMLGFSDGTKDGGYLMANYGIYRAKDELTKVSREFGIDVVFFDGRGGPPARGGGKTHKFYASMGENISDKALELTVQGQTVSSNFGTVAAARYNIEQMLNAGIYNSVLSEKKDTFTASEEKLMQALAEFSFQAYSELKNDPLFLEYLENVSPLKFYARTNIGSRPAKRGGASQKLSLDSLRAIPFVGAWSQMKQNVPGFYGVGTALREMEEHGKLAEITELYERNRFFRALIDNSEMAMQKTFFPLTEYLKNDEKYGAIWRKIYAEYELSYKYLGIITSNTSFMTDFPVAQASVRMREKIVLPLTTIQQYALSKLREDETDLKSAYEKLVVRCSFGIINAGRNSA